VKVSGADNCIDQPSVGLCCRAKKGPHTIESPLHVRKRIFVRLGVNYSGKGKPAGKIAAGNLLSGTTAILVKGNCEDSWM